MSVLGPSLGFYQKGHNNNRSSLSHCFDMCIKILVRDSTNRNSRATLLGPNKKTVRSIGSWAQQGSRMSGIDKA